MTERTEVSIKPRQSAIADVGDIIQYTEQRGHLYFARYARVTRVSGDGKVVFATDAEAKDTVTLDIVHDNVIVPEFVSEAIVARLFPTLPTTMPDPEEVALLAEVQAALALAGDLPPMPTLRRYYADAKITQVPRDPETGEPVYAQDENEDADICVYCGLAAGYHHDGCPALDTVADPDDDDETQLAERYTEGAGNMLGDRITPDDFGYKHQPYRRTFPIAPLTPTDEDDDDLPF